MENKKVKLLGKIILSGNLKTKTGLHIGGSKSTLAIGGIDNNVIKDALDRPYIPGSSLKGKLRSLLAKYNGALFFSRKEKQKHIENMKGLGEDATDDEKELFNLYTSLVTSQKNTDEDYQEIMELFGYSGDSEGNEDRVGYTQLLVRDAFLDKSASENNIFSDRDNRSREDKYTDVKWENVINRRTGTADNPRQMERVPAGASFKFEMVYNIYGDPEQEKTTKDKVQLHLNAIICALRLLEDDGIGGQISRGYGQVKVENLLAECKLLGKDYSYQTYESVNNPIISKEEVSKLLDSVNNNFQNV